MERVGKRRNFPIHQKKIRFRLKNVYPVESPTVYGGDEEKNAHSLLRVGFKAPPFLMGFTLYETTFLFYPGPYPFIGSGLSDPFPMERSFSLPDKPF
jgi:hypothetical protein